MIDTTTPKGKLIEAALRLAETRKWSDVFLAELPFQREIDADIKATEEVMKELGLA